MSETVKVEYLGKTKNLALALPYLSAKVVFKDSEGHVAEMIRHEAEQLVAENPKGFRIISTPSLNETFYSADGDGAEGSVPETGDDGNEQAESEDAQSAAEGALAGLQKYLETLPDNKAIVDFCESTYGVGDLNPRRRTENLIKDAVDAIAGVMEAGTN